MIAPVPDELAWIAKLAARFDVELSPHAAVVFEELSAKLYGGLTLEDLGDQAPLAARAPYAAPEPRAASPASAPKASVPAGGHVLDELRLLPYRPLFSGPQVERVAELQFLRPQAEVALSVADAERRGISTGDEVTVRSNGTSVALRARVDRRLVDGVARIADEHAGDLHQQVEVVKA